MIDCADAWALYSLERSIEWKLNKCLPWVLSHEKALYSLERSIEWKHPVVHVIAQEFGKYPLYSLERSIEWKPVRER